MSRNEGILCSPLFHLRAGLRPFDQIKSEMATKNLKGGVRVTGQHPSAPGHYSLCRRAGRENEITVIGATSKTRASAEKP
jgi:hypothetical protein